MIPAVKTITAPTGTSTMALPKSGSMPIRKTGSASAAKLNKIWVILRILKSILPCIAARNHITPSLANSDGCKRIGPRSIQLFAPFTVRPTKSTSTSNATANR